MPEPWRCPRCDARLNTGPECACGEPYYPAAWIVEDGVTRLATALSEWAGSPLCVAAFVWRPGEIGSRIMVHRAKPDELPAVLRAWLEHDAERMETATPPGEQA